MLAKLTQNQFISKSNIIHTYKYDYKDVKYKNTITQIIIKCPIHGKFKQIPASHLNGYGCPKCGNLKSIKFRTKTNKQFIIDAKKIHGNKYDYSKSNYTNSHTNIIIICPIHKEFLQLPSNHLTGEGCKECKYENLSILQPKSIEKFISQSNKKHNNFYNYSKFIYTNAYTPGIIICPIHGEFKQIPNNHIHGANCPYCFKTISHQEIQFLDYLKISNTPKNRQVNILNKRVDGFIPETNTIYEFLGDYWHGNPERFNLNDFNKTCHITFQELYNNTFNRLKFLKQLGYNIKYIWGLDWKRYKNGTTKNPKIIEYL